MKGSMPLSRFSFWQSLGLLIITIRNLQDLESMQVVAGFTAQFQVALIVELARYLKGLRMTVLQVFIAVMVGPRTGDG
jgi:hypothetical protein